MVYTVMGFFLWEHNASETELSFTFSHTVTRLQENDEAAVFKAVMTFLEQQWQIWCSADLPIFKQRYVCLDWLVTSLVVAVVGVFETF